MSKDPTRADYVSDFTIRFKSIVAASEREKCAAELEDLGFGPGNLSVPLVGSGDAADADATHYATDWQCTPDEYAVIEPVLTKYGCKIVKQNESDKKVIESNVAASHAKVGQPLSFDAAVGDANLKRRVGRSGGGLK